MKMRLRISTGTDSFRKLVTESDIFVDKTLFIKEILDSGEEAILITRPRRWGKPLALDMLKTFLAIEVDATGSKVEVNSRKILFEGGTVDLGQELKLLKKLKIAQEDPKYIKRQGFYPVIHLSLKDVKALTSDQANKLLKNAIKESFQEHYYLTNSLKLSPFQRAQLERYYKAFLEDDLLDEARLKESIHFLSEVLETHHDQKVYILVDEYDKPVNFFLENDLDTNIKERDALANLVESILSKCGKDNKHLQKIILIGIFDSLKKEGNSGFNNVAVYGITNAEFSNHFGFSVEEVRSLVKKLDLKNQDQFFNNIKDWYNGYSVPVSGNNHMQAYTPWSVMRYLSAVNNDDTTSPQNYWVQSGASTMFQMLLKKEKCNNSPLANSLLNITKLGNVTLEYNAAISLFKYDLTEASIDGRIFSYLLLNSGYLTALAHNTSHIILAIPNYEVKEELKDVFNTHVKSVKNKKGDVCTSIQKAFNLDQDKHNSSEGFRGIIEQNLKILEQFLPKCSDQKYSVNPLHLAAMSGSIEVFKMVVDKCKNEGFYKSNNLTLADYAYMSSNNEILDLVKSYYKVELSITMPGKTDYMMCNIHHVSNTAIGTLGTLGVGAIVAKIQGFFANMPQFLQNHPYISVVAGVALLSPFAYSKVYNYTEICDNYYTFEKITPPAFHAKSLSELLKYRLLHSDASYIKLGSECDAENFKISQFDSGILKSSQLDPTYGQFTAVLCTKTLLDESKNSHSSWFKAGECALQLTTLGLMGKFLYNLYQLSGPVYQASGALASLTGPLVAANTAAKHTESWKIAISGIIEFGALYVDSHACPDTLSNLYEYFNSVKLVGEGITD